MSPFGQPHTVEDDAVYFAYKKFANDFYPQTKQFRVGAFIVDTKANDAGIIIEVHIAMSCVHSIM